MNLKAIISISAIIIAQFFSNGLCVSNDDIYFHQEQIRKIREESKIKGFNECKNQIIKKRQLAQTIEGQIIGQEECDTCGIKEQIVYQEIPRISPEKNEHYFKIVRMVVAMELVSGIAYANSMFLPPSKYQGIKMPRTCLEREELSGIAQHALILDKELYPDGSISENQYAASEMLEVRKQERLNSLSDWLNIALSIKALRAHLKELENQEKQHKASFAKDFHFSGTAWDRGFDDIGKELLSEAHKRKSEIRELEEKIAYLEEYKPILNTKFGDTQKTFLQMIEESDLSRKDLEGFDVYTRVALNESLVSMHKTLELACSADNKKIADFSRAREIVANKVQDEEILNAHCALKAEESTKGIDKEISMAFVLPLALLALPGLPAVIAAWGFTGYMGLEAHKSWENYNEIKHRFQAGFDKASFATLKEVKSAKSKTFLKAALTLVSGVLTGATSLAYLDDVAKLNASLQRMGAQVDEVAEGGVAIVVHEGKALPTSRFQEWITKAREGGNKLLVRVKDEANRIYYETLLDETGAIGARNGARSLTPQTRPIGSGNSYARPSSGSPQTRPISNSAASKPQVEPAAQPRFPAGSRVQTSRPLNNQELIIRGRADDLEPGDFVIFARDELAKIRNITPAKSGNIDEDIVEILLLDANRVLPITRDGISSNPYNALKSITALGNLNVTSQFTLGLNKYRLLEIIDPLAEHVPLSVKLLRIVP